MDLLVDYARTQYKYTDHKSFELYGNLSPEIEELMPKLCENSEQIKKTWSQ